MTFEVLVSDGLKREIRVSIDGNQFSNQVNERIRQVASEIQLRGFRPGKVPPAHVKKLHGETLLRELLPEIVSASTRECLEELAIKPAYDPDIELAENAREPKQLLNLEGDLIFDLKFETMPEIDLDSTKNISLERPVAIVSEPEVESEMALLAERYQQFEDKDEAAIVEAGDRVIYDSKATSDGKDYEPLTGTDRPIVLGDNFPDHLLPIREGLIGAKVGDVVTVQLVNPADIADQESPPAGIEASFTVQKISSPKQTSFDELAQQLGLEGEVSLRSELRIQLENRNSERSQERLHRRLLDALSDSYELELPQKMVDNELAQIQNMVKQAKAMPPAPASTTDASDGDSSDSDSQSADDSSAQSEQSELPTEEEALALAQRRVKLGLLFIQVGNEANIQVTEDDIRARLSEEAARIGVSPDQLSQFFAKDQAKFDKQIKLPAYERKIVEFLIDRATVVDKKVTREELDKDDPSRFDNLEQLHERQVN